MNARSMGCKSYERLMKSISTSYLFGTYGIFYEK